MKTHRDAVRDGRRSEGLCAALCLALALAVLSGGAFAQTLDTRVSVEKQIIGLDAGGFFIPGTAQLQVRVTISYSDTETVNALGYKETVPAGWTYAGFAPNPGDDVRPDVRPANGDTGLLSFAYIAVPELPVSFGYLLNAAPLPCPPMVELAGFAEWRTTGGALVSETVTNVIQEEPTAITFTRALSGPGVAGTENQFYVPGETIDITITFEKTGPAAINALGFQDTTPAGWTFVSLAPGDPIPAVKPAVGDSGLLSFAYIEPPAFPASFTYKIRVAADATEGKTIGGTISTGEGPKTSAVLYRTCGPPLESPSVEYAFVNEAPCVQVSRAFFVAGSGTTAAGSYTADATLDVRVTISYIDPLDPCDVSALGYKETVPAGWTYVGFGTANPLVEEQRPDVRPAAGDTGTLGFAYIAVPDLAAGAVFTYRIRAAVDSVDEQVFSGFAEYRLNAGTLVSDSFVSAITDADLVPPVITLLGDAVVTVECHTVYTDAGATALDNVDGDITGNIQTTNTVDANAVGSYTVTYNVSDAAGNPAIPVVRTVNVVDTTAPVITLLGQAAVTVECSTLYLDAGATAQDSCDGALTPAVSGAVNVNAVGVYTLTYNVSDAAGHAATPVQRTVTVVDTTAPVITRLGAAAVTVECHTSYTDAGATAQDTCGGALTPVLTGTVNVDVEGVYTLTYNVSDAAGNAATPVQRTVTVVDTTAPVITRIGAAVVQVECQGVYTELGATATDSCDTALGAVVVTGTVDTTTVGSYTIAYNVSDAAGNAATQVTRTVAVIDTTAPVITLLGDAQVTVECGASYTDAGATVADACDDAVVVQTVNPVNTAVPGVYSVTYNAADAIGNQAIQRIRTVTVVDTTVPVLTLLGDAEVAVECGGSYTDAGATAADSCDDDTLLTESIVLTGAVDVQAVGTYLLTYAVSDASGNAAVPVTRTVTVADSLKPVISLLGNAQVLVQCGGAYTDAGATVADTCDAAVQVVTTGQVDTGNVGVYTITYNATDAAGNAADPVTRTVTVSDTTAPVLTLLGQATVTVDCGTQYVDAGASATDVCDGLLTSSILVTGGPVTTVLPGVFTLTYNVSDGAGNAALPVTRTVVVSGAGCGQQPCDLESVTITAPLDGSRVVVEAGANKTVNFSAQVAYESNCIEGPVQVRYFVNGVLVGASQNATAGFPVSANLTAAPGETQYAVRADAVVLETSNTVSDEVDFILVGLTSFAGFPPDPFTNLPNEGDNWTAQATMPGATCPRAISLTTWFGPCGPGAVAPVTVALEQPGDPDQVVTVSIPRAIAACGQQAIVVLGISCDLIGLLGMDQAALLAAIPAGSALVPDGAPFEISIIVKDNAGNVIEVDNALIAANPITISLSGMSFTADFKQKFLSHSSDVTGEPLQVLAGGGGWSDGAILDPTADGDTLTAETSSLSVFLAVEEPKIGPTLSITPNPAYETVMGIVEVGKKFTKDFTVKNIGSGTLVGTATLLSPSADAAAAFKIISGANFSLTTGQTATVRVEFTPKKVGNIAATIRFSAQNNQVADAVVKGTGTIFNKRFTFFGCGPASGSGSGLFGDALVALGLFGAMMLAGRVYRRRES